MDSFCLSQKIKIASSIVRSAVALAVFFMQVPRGCYNKLSPPLHDERRLQSIFVGRYMQDVAFEYLVVLSI